MKWFEHIRKSLEEHRMNFWGFVLCALIIALMVPKAQSFKYQYSEGRPWRYDLLTAPYDFPIYKSDAELEHHRDSVQRAVLSVYRHDREVERQMLQELHDEYQMRMAQEIPSRYYHFVQARLVQLYENGLIQASEQAKLRAREQREVYLLDGGMKATPLGQFYDLKGAYDQLRQDLPKQIDLEVLERMDLSRFLRDNIIYDQETSQRLLDDKLGLISLSSGQVQRGERIIDRGEIVTPAVYNVLASLERESNRRNDGGIDDYLVGIGFGVITLLLLVIVSLYLLYSVPTFDKVFKNVLLLQSSMLIFVMATALVVDVHSLGIYVIPYVMLVILWRLFFDSHTALLMFVTTILCSALFVPDVLSFIVMQMVSGLAALVSMRQLRNRGQMIRASFIVFVAYVATALALELVMRGGVGRDYLWVLFALSINLVLLMFTYVLIFIIERIFGYVSHTSLVELGDINTPLLRKLSETAPGTFMHSMQVSILASEAAEQVGGNVTLIRTGALYHDIGKLKNPAYFTENQGGTNPHDLLMPQDSAQVIIRHVIDGIALAQKHNLPSQIIDFIRTHHGTSMVRYFYNTACNTEGEEAVKVEAFTYPGPMPWTKEQGILMLADAVEASSRSLSEYSEEHLKVHVARIVDSIVAEGQLMNTPITFRDIETIKAVFVTKLVGIYHTRISYPDKR